MSDALDLSRLTKFSAFADECDTLTPQRQDSIGVDSPLCTGGDICPACRKLYALAEIAARHARLLARIEQWAQPLRTDVFSASHAKAEVLRLLREEKG